MLLQDHNGRGAIRTEGAEAIREVRRQRELPVAGEVVTSVMREGIGIHEDQECKGGDGPDGGRCAGGRSTARYQDQAAEQFHRQRQGDWTTPAAKEIAATRANRPKEPSPAARRLAVFHCSIDGKAVAARVTPTAAARMPVSPIERERNLSRVPRGCVAGGPRSTSRRS